MHMHNLSALQRLQLDAAGIYGLAFLTIVYLILYGRLFLSSFHILDDYFYAFSGHFLGCFM